MPLATFSEAAKLMGYKSRSQLYKLKRDGWFNDYIAENTQELSRSTAQREGVSR